MIASVTLESAVVTAVILVSLWRVDLLPLVTQLPPLPLPAPARNAVTIVAAENAARTSAAALPVLDRVFREPAAIPREVAKIHDLDVGVPGLPQGLVGDGDGAKDGVVGMLAALASPMPRASAPPPPPPTPAAAQSATKPPAVIRVGGEVQEAKLIKRVMPIYPPLARQARIQGVVRLNSVIAKDGTVQQLQVLEGHPLLAPAAVEAVRQWVYRPTLLNKEPVEVLAPITVTFTLSH